jgi:SAM-dependent methyltransferase
MASGEPVGRTVPPASTYTFGDSEQAGDRLGLLAATFEPTSDDGLRRAVDRIPTLAVDLGCGPGHTTRLVATATRAARTVGLDSSPAFIDRARRVHGPWLEFALHDVARTPFPTGPADFVFARFVLAHLREPGGVLQAWCTQLSVGGRLVSEETEQIDTSVDTFALYEAMASEMVAHHGAALYAGAVTRELPAPPDTRVVMSEPVVVRPPTAVAARLFAMNLATWRHDAFVRERVPEQQIERIARGLSELTGSGATNELTFRNRRVVYERIGGSGHRPH